MRIIAHDEDSMTNLFFSELHRNSKIETFLKSIIWRSHPDMPFDISSVELHQQINFSEFGKPDVLILLTDSQGKKHVVIVEVKLGKYLESCIGVDDGKFNNKYNSKLNNQLALKYRAMISLSSIVGKGHITESTHTSESPYSEDIPRRCKKPSTVTFFREVGTVDKRFYLVTLTSDKLSPTAKEQLDISDPCFPLFYNQSLETQEEYCNLGSILWSQCRQLFNGVDSYISESFALHFDHEAEQDNEVDKSELFAKDRLIIKYAGKICLLTSKSNGYSFAIRHFRNGHFVEIYRGKNDREKYLELKTQIQIIEDAPAKSIKEVSFWDNYFKKIQA